MLRKRHCCIPSNGGQPQLSRVLELNSETSIPHRYCRHISGTAPDSKVHGDNMGSIWGRQDPCGPHAVHRNLAIWGVKRVNVELVLDNRVWNLNYYKAITVIYVYMIWYLGFVLCFTLHKYYNAFSDLNTRLGHCCDLIRDSWTHIFYGFFVNHRCRIWISWLHQLTHYDYTKSSNESILTSSMRPVGIYPSPISQRVIS